MSDKCKLVDQTTFQLLQQSTSTSAPLSSGRKVRNAKYKRMSANSGFDLLMFMKEKVAQDDQNKTKIHKIRQNRNQKNEYNNKTIQKKGKQRENAANVSHTRLKRAILRYRQTKTQENQSSPDDPTTKPQDMAAVSSESSNKMRPIHTRKFREYCNTAITPDLQQHSEKLLRDLNFFQRRAYSQNEIKAQAHRRFVVGFRQVQSYLNAKKVRLVIIATDCEKCDNDEGGLDQTIASIKTLCENQNVPIAFPFERRKLAYILFKRASISCVGIMDYDGARDTFALLLLAINEARKLYEDRIQESTT